jgi:hypothetical protein
VTGLKLTVHESAVRERAPTESAVNELTFHKVHDIKDTPVPINILKRAGGEIRLDVFAFRSDPQELTVLKAILTPINCPKVVACDDEALHLCA